MKRDRNRHSRIACDRLYRWSGLVGR